MLEQGRKPTFDAHRSCAGFLKHWRRRLTGGRCDRGNRCPSLSCVLLHLACSHGNAPPVHQFFDEIRRVTPRGRHGAQRLEWWDYDPQGKSLPPPHWPRLRIAGTIAPIRPGRTHEGGIRSSCLPAICPERLPARCPSVTDRGRSRQPPRRRRESPSRDAACLLPPGDPRSEAAQRHGSAPRRAPRDKHASPSGRPWRSVLQRRARHRTSCARPSRAD